jgi:hypothetical protein
LKKPTPLPNRMSPIMNDPRAPLGWAMTCGMAAMMIKMWPTVARQMAT